MTIKKDYVVRISLLIYYMKNEFILKYQGKELKQGYQWIDGNHTIYLSNRLGKDIIGTSIEEYNINPNPTLFQFNLEIRTINPTYELNTKFYTLFKDCVYGGDNDIAVKVWQFEFEGKVYKGGDVFRKNCEDAYVHLRYTPDMGLHPYSFYTLNSGERVLTPYLNIDCLIKLNGGVLVGNLLDEYLAGKNELAKLCGF